MPSSRGALFSSLIVLCLAAAAGANEAPATQSVGGAQPEKPFVIRLLAEGKPAPHAIVCTEHEESADSSSLSTVKWVVGHHSHSRPFVSDDSGVATLPFDEVFPFHVDNQQALYALDAATGRVAIAKVRRDAANRELTLTLQPACDVWGTIACPVLSARSTPFKHHVILDWNGIGNVLSANDADGHFQFLLPSGQYTIRVGGCGQGIGPKEMDDLLVPFGGIPLEEQTLSLTIQPGQRRADFPVKLDPSPLGKLVGQPAPELQNIIAWKNSPPLKLAGLRGKVVVLDFWGYWCYPCVRAMPTLMALHEKYKDQGLVIIGIHDNQAKSMEDLDKKLANIRVQFWKGRDIPFPIALDGGGKSGTVATYHVELWPTTLIIDKEGKLVHVQDMNSMGIEPLIRELLGLPAAADPKG